MRGVYTALVTPFDSDLKLDLAAYRKILEDQAAAGITGVVPCGTTGETPALTVDEKKTLIQTAISTFKGSGIKVIAGTGTNNTDDSIALSRWASDQGADGVLLITPYYNKPSQAGLEAHFKAVADAVRCEVMLYNVPGRTGVCLAPATVVGLAGHPRIRSLKEATGDMTLDSEILDRLKLAGKEIDLLSGDDATCLPLYSIGGVGVVSVAGNLFPRAMVALHKHTEKGDWTAARSLHQKYYPLFRDLFVESNPGPIKRAMEIAGFCHSRLRPPLAKLARDSQATLEASLERCGIHPGGRQ